MIGYLTFYIIGINLLSYFLMWKDKAASKNGKWRIPEKNLLFSAIAGGSIGIFLGLRFPLFHKTNKSLFKFGIPIIMLIQICLATYLYIY